MDVATAGAAAFAIIDRAKQAWALAEKLSNVELQAAVLAVREEAITLSEENLRLRAENLELRQRLEQREEVVFDGEVLRKKADPQHPLCAGCQGSKGQLIYLRLWDRHEGGTTTWRCPACDKDYVVGLRPR
jgi:hypothetical protein